MTAFELGLPCVPMGVYEAWGDYFVGAIEDFAVWVRGDGGCDLGYFVVFD